VADAGDHERALNDLAERLEGEAPDLVPTIRRSRGGACSGSGQKRCTAD
jgi:hypothetical protein